MSQSWQKTTEGLIAEESASKEWVEAVIKFKNKDLTPASLKQSTLGLYQRVIEKRNLF